MKPFKLKQQESFVNTLKEPPLQKKKVNWHRIIYLTLLLLGLLFIGRKLYYNHQTILADGQIELPKQTIKFTSDIQILNFFIQKGEYVNPGDTIFTYKILTDQIDANPLNPEQKSKDWIIKEKMTYQKNIALNLIQIQNKKDLLDLLNESLHVKEKLLLGGVHKEYREYSELQEQKARIQSEILALKKENIVYQKFIQNLNIEETNNQQLDQSKFNWINEIKYYIAPTDGRISEIFYGINEICYKKEELLTILKKEGAFINTFFDPDELPYLNVGDQVMISFPDGSKSEGLISKFHMNTYELPSEFQNKYEPTKRNIVAEVVPIHRKEINNWKNFYKMNVKVEKIRRQFGLYFPKN